MVTLLVLALTSPSAAAGDVTAIRKAAALNSLRAIYAAPRPVRNPAREIAPCAPTLPAPCTVPTATVSPCAVLGLPTLGVVQQARADVAHLSDGLISLQP